jgi:hypothetical protein
VEEQGREEVTCMMCILGLLLGTSPHFFHATWLELPRNTRPVYSLPITYKNCTSYGSSLSPSAQTNGKREEVGFRTCGDKADEKNLPPVSMKFVGMS